MKILVAGDFCPQNRVAGRFEQGDYKSVLGDVIGVVSNADYSIVNFECSVTKGGEKPIEKCGSSLHCSEKGIEAAKWAGFDCVTLANNHFLDFGEDGVKNTFDACKKYEIDTVGGGNNLENASHVLYKNINGQTLAIINCCEHEFSIATKTMAGSNPLNPIQQYYAILEARKNAHYVLVIVHGGHEHYQLPSPRMQETYRFFVDAGADAVVNHHQHCYSGYEVYNNRPIFYGLGNFCFDKPKRMNDLWYEGYMVQLTFGEERNKYEIIPYIQCANKTAICLISSNTFDEKLVKLNNIIKDKQELEDSLDTWVRTGIKRYEIIFQPFYTRLTNALYSRNLLPSMLDNTRKKIIYNYISCESHLDCLLKTLKV
jgi:poly-gamma-glutamate synthesis protein (capsule biosynthesis protein)